jgi:hypothetical protein
MEIDTMCGTFMECMADTDFQIGIVAVTFAAAFVLLGAVAIICLLGGDE